MFTNDVDLIGMLEWPETATRSDTATLASTTASRAAPQTGRGCARRGLSREEEKVNGNLRSKLLRKWAEVVRREECTGARRIQASVVVAVP